MRFIYYHAHKPYLSMAFKRIEDGIFRTMPEDAKFTNSFMNADLVIVPVIGTIDSEIAENSIIWQLCYKTAGGDDEYWQYIWNKAQLVVSYYDLPAPKHKFIRIPLGYDPTLFFLPGTNVEKKYKALVTGYINGKSGEVINDAWEAFGNIAHVGGNLNLGEGYTNFERISDGKLRELYWQSEYVIGMRYVEGFELPILEGTACGCQPITFNYECYTHWFGDFAFTVNPHKNIVKQLQEIDTRHKHNPQPDMTKFHWKNVMKPFWERIKW